MIDLYSEEDLSIIKRKYNYVLSWIWTFLFALITGEALFIFLSIYKYRILYAVFSSIYGVILVSLFIYFMDKKSFYSTLQDEYTAILNAEQITYVGEIISVTEKPITMNDSTTAYELLIKIDDKEKALYLSGIFDTEFIKLNQKVTLSTCFDYIRGYQYED